MDRRFWRLKRAPLMLLLAALPIALSGCPNISASTVLPELGAYEAKLVASATTVTAGERVTFDYSGSRTEKGNCPEYPRQFVDAEPADDAASTDRGSAKQRFSTLETGGVCSVAVGQFVAAFAGGAPGSTATHDVTVLVEGSDDDAVLLQSTAKVRITVKTPGPAGAPGTTPTQPGSVPTTVPPGEPTAAPPTACEDRHIGGGATPDLHAYYVNPTPPVSGRTVLLGMRATDPDGTIVRYHYDTDGDGVLDRTDSANEIALTAGAPGPIGFCMAAEDDSGNVTHGRLMVQVQPAGTLYGSAIAGPARPKVGVAETFGISPSPAGATTHDVEWDDGGAPDLRAANAAGQTVNHTYAAPGWRMVVLTTIDPAATSSWFYPVEVVTGARPGLRVSYDGGGASAAKRYTLAAALKPAGPVKVITRGKPKYDVGVLSTKGAIVKARAKGKLPRKLAKVKALKGLTVLYDADFAVKLDATRVLLGPATWGISGKGVLLAQSRKSRSTRICMSVTSDGRTLAGTRWKILGATGKARKLGGSGTYAPQVVGPRIGAEPSGKATITTGKARGIGRCKSLVKVLR